MEDAHILELYWERSEAAIEATAAKYGAYCYTIAYHILANAEDTDESVNDTYLDAWNSVSSVMPFCGTCSFCAWTQKTIHTALFHGIV